MQRIDTIVIGSGVIGLAVARQLALSGREVAILECENVIGAKLSSRNSEVIHAGIYYEKDSLKARFCTRGKELLYNYCSQKNIPHNKIGKIIVAVKPSNIPMLDSIEMKARCNGVTDLRKISKEKLKELEPNITGEAGIFSPSTGILDSHSYMVNLLSDAQEHNCHLALNNKVVGLTSTTNGIVVKIRANDDEEYEMLASNVVNCGGLNAWDILKLIKTDTGPIPPKYYAKGSYFKLSGSSPFNHLVYPTPVQGGLGIHSTMDMAGRIKFGPNVEWVEEEEYSVDPNLEDTFRNSIATYFPEIKNRTLHADYCGIRPKLSGPNQPDKDFFIQTECDHKISGLINLFGFESPGLTSSLAIAEEVELLLKTLKN